MARGPPSRTTSKTALIQAPGDSRERWSCGSCLGDRQARVLAAEPERVRQRDFQVRRLPPAPRRCPIADFVDETGGGVLAPLNTDLIAAVSILSLNGVPVPCALT